MKLGKANVCGNKTRIVLASASFMGQYQLLDFAQNVLEAWPKLGCAKELLEWLTKNPDKNRVSLLDSGVFSAWSLGEQVDRDKYTEFLKQETLFNYWVGIDRIPAERGRIPTAEEVEASAQETWNNFQYMIDKGINPCKLISVFHQNEGFHWLEKLVEFDEQLKKQGHKEGLYIGISPANDRTAAQRILWLEQCMPYVTNPDGSAKIRFHGFGATSRTFLNRYPWFSGDSTSWLRPGAMGQLKVPKFELKHPHYDSNIQVAMTARSGLSQGSKHFNGLSKNEQEQIVKYIEENNFKLEDVQSDGKQGVIARQTINLKYWKKLEAELNTMDNRWKRSQGSFV